VVLLVTTAAELRDWRATKPGQRIAFVPTMGALHEGHIRLVERAREIADAVVVSIFVNPTQFGQGEDFERYPRTLENDVGLLADLADVVYAPSVDDVYPPDAPPPVKSAGPAGAGFAGAARPGHFDGMLTVVNRLFDIVNPDVAVFGQKDAQQVHLVRRLARERGGPEIDVVTTVREDDGLALSSRNRYLSSDERAAASAVPETVRTVAAQINTGVSAALAAGRAVLAAEPLARLEYLELVSPADFTPVDDTFHGEATLVVAARFGATRLLDTEMITVP
jgi:pantoate--beta-alanine ligase